MRRACACIAALLLLQSGTAASAQSEATAYLPWTIGESQFLNRETYPWWNERYENYSRLSYRDYGSLSTRGENPTYDPFGAYLLDGVELLRLEEFSTLAPQRSSRIFRSAASDRSLADPFRNLVIMRDHYKSWSARVMVGDALPAEFSGLTLNRPRLQGMRWDGSSFKNRFSLLGGRVSEPVVSGSNDLAFATYLLGGHWESQVGDLLTFGASWVNLHVRDSLRRKGSLQGSFPSDLARGGSYHVVVSDDSPEDGVGPSVFAVNLELDGVIVDQPALVRRVRTGILPDDVAHLRRDGAWATEGLRPSRVFTDRTGLLATAAEPAVKTQGRWTVTGTQLLVFTFDVPQEAESIRFHVQAAGDYSIDAAASHTLAGNRPWSDWHNVSRASGNVQDGSNLRWERFDYGFPTGLATYGSNFRFQWEGTTVEGELVENVGYESLPAGGGHLRQSRRAFHLRGLHAGSVGRIGGELFRMPSDFQNSLWIWSNHARRPVRFALVTDNDDDDHWNDEWEHWDPLDPVYQQLRDASGFDPESEPTPDAEDNLAGNLGRGLGYGVFPGLDRDGDGVYDINVNDNQLPDYAEPFLMYAVDPDAFVYGDDLNNNGVVDERENDNTPDFPHDLDSRGGHIFGGMTLMPGTDVRLGHYRIRQPAAGGRNRVTYLEASFDATLQDVGSLAARARTRRVRDDIADPVYHVVIDPLTSTNTSVRTQPDALLMKNSWVHTLFADVQYTPLRDVSVSAATRFDWNQLGDANDGGSRIRDWTWIAKTHYTWRRGRLRVYPMAKVMVQRRAAPARLQLPLQTTEMFPILRADYDVGEATTLRAGIQGLPLLPHRFRNAMSRSADFNARHLIFVVQNRSNYTGYSLSLNFGFRMGRTQFIHQPGTQVQRFREFFVRARVA